MSKNLIRGNNYIKLLITLEGFFVVKRIKNERKNINVEDTTVYGEFISSFDNWITMDKQKKRVEHIEKVTDKSNEQ